MVFVYGGGEGSQIAVPVTNKMLRYYFKIKDEATEEDEAEEEAPAPAVQTDSNFTARLLGTDTWSSDKAGVSGFVLDSTGQGLANTVVEVITGGQVVAQVTSGETGQFDFTELDPTQATTWQLRLPGYPGAPPLQLEVAKGLRYLVEFRAQLPAATAPPAAQG
jgi:hypothetical protein